MRTRILIFLIILFPAGKMLEAQDNLLSTEAAISLLTCGPGPEVYSYFGHSALRVSDPVLKIDRVYNYGTFDFSVPNFYAQFINGKLYYMLSVVRYQGFYPDYMNENRFIKELPLNITPDQKQELFNLLEINYLPENRHYWYDFFLDNCSTRIRDIVVKATNGEYQWPAEPADHLSYRQLIMPYISLNSWAKTGILLMLAAGADQEPMQEGYMFLPDHMHRLFAQARSQSGTPLCGTERVIFEPDYPKPIGTGLVHPYSVLSLLVLLSWLIAFYRKVPRSLIKSWFAILFFLSGALGLLFSYMWIFSAHVVCHANLNLAWAVPLNIALAVIIWFPRATRAAAYYSRIALAIMVIFLATFFLWKQKIPFEAILFCLALLPGLIRFSGLKVFGNPKTKDQTN
jgi:hypothetical protein